MKVLHVNKRYPPHVGGVEAHVRTLARSQAARPGLEVEVLAVAEGPPIVERDDGVLVHRVRGWGTLASNPLSFHVLRFLARADHDVWHFHYPFPTGELSLLAARLTRKALPRIVVTYHSDFVGVSGFKRTMVRPYAELTRRFLQQVDAVLVSSPELARRSSPLREVGDKVRVVPFGIDPGPLAANAERVGRAGSLRRLYGTPLVLFVGRLVPYKGVDVLLRAWPYVDASLILVGDGPLRPALQRQADALGVAARVHFVGRLDDEDLAAAFHAADVFVLPSVTRNEAFGLVQLEAHACGVPVVSTDLPTGVPFANRHGISGLIVPPGDVAALAAALSLLVEDEGLRRRLGEGARRRFQQEFSLERMTERVLAVYADVAGAG